MTKLKDGWVGRGGGEVHIGGQLPLNNDFFFFGRVLLVRLEFCFVNFQSLLKMLSLQSAYSHLTCFSNFVVTVCDLILFLSAHLVALLPL